MLNAYNRLDAYNNIETNAIYVYAYIQWIKGIYLGISLNSINMLK
jgi:hypothetical protein